MTTPLEAYRRMFLIRTVEEQLAAYYLKNKIFSFVHFCVGQEAVAVGVCDALRPGDRVFGNHRSHGHYLAKGGDLKRMVAELLGKESGCCNGYGGSMHLIDKSAGYMGSTPILGSVVPIAAGSAFEQRYNKTGGVTVVFFGDGAFEEGVVYETLNLAALFHLPILFVVENNGQATNSPVSARRSAMHDSHMICNGFGMPCIRIKKGNDYLEVNHAARTVMQSMEADPGPILLECFTHRHMAHSGPLMEEGYRESDTAEARATEDCVANMRRYLLETGETEGHLKFLEDFDRAGVGQSIEEAEAQA